MMTDHPSSPAALPSRETGARGGWGGRKMFRGPFTVLGLLPMLAAVAPADAQHPARLGRSPVVAPHGMVATSHPLAAEIGLDVLKQGGNAVDAAVATSAAMGLMEPM